MATTQKASTAQKETAKHRAVNIANRERKLGKEKPYARWTDTRTGWRYTLLKSWQVDNGKEQARWFMWVEGWESEYGDTFVADMFPGLKWARDIEFDEALWENKTRFLEWAQGTGG